MAFDQILTNHIKNAIESEIQKACTEEIEEAQKRLTRRIDQIVAQTAIRTMQFIDMETRGDRLVISVRKPEAP